MSTVDVDRPALLGRRRDVVDVGLDVRLVHPDPDVESYVDHVAPPTEEGRPVDVDG